MGVVGHVLENHELAAARAEAAQVGIGRIHQSRHLEQAFPVILGLICRDVELRVACKDILDAARTVDPGNAVGRRRRLRRRRLAEPPGDPAAGRTKGRRVFARDAPARIIIKAVLQREGKQLIRTARPIDLALLPVAIHHVVEIPLLRIPKSLVKGFAAPLGQRVNAIYLRIF